MLAPNIDKAERVLRCLIGLILIVIPAVLNWPSWAIAILAAVGGSMLIEGYIGYCPMYHKLGRSSSSDQNPAK